MSRVQNHYVSGGSLIFARLREYRKIFGIQWIATSACNINDADESSGTKLAVRIRHSISVHFSREFGRNNVSFTASEPPSTMACERCINAPGHNSPANERARFSASAEWACDLMVPKHAYEILRFREFFHFRASAATPLPLAERWAKTTITSFFWRLAPTEFLAGKHEKALRPKSRFVLKFDIDAFNFAKKLNRYFTCDF